MDNLMMVDGQNGLIIGSIIIGIALVFSLVTMFPANDQSRGNINPGSVIFYILGMGIFWNVGKENPELVKIPVLVSVVMMLIIVAIYIHQRNKYNDERPKKQALQGKLKAKKSKIRIVFEEDTSVGKAPGYFTRSNFNTIAYDPKRLNDIQYVDMDDRFDVIDEAPICSEPADFYYEIRTAVPGTVVKGQIITNGVEGQIWLKMTDENGAVTYIKAEHLCAHQDVKIIRLGKGEVGTMIVILVMVLAMVVIGIVNVL